jgi:hypothetical protein
MSDGHYLLSSLFCVLPNSPSVCTGCSGGLIRLRTQPDLPHRSYTSLRVFTAATRLRYSYYLSTPHFRQCSGNTWRSTATELRDD